MRKAVSLFMSLMLAFTIGACGTDTSEGAAAPEEPAVTEAEPAAAEQEAPEAEPAVSVSAEDIDSLLQGAWALEGSADTMSFEDGKVVISGSGQMLSGSYEVDTEESAVIGHIETSDATLKITIPYSYEDGVLKIFNNRGAEMFKQ